MAIEANYISKIEEIQQHADSLTDWEKGFMFGDGGDNRPIIEREMLSSKQKDLVDRIYRERVEGADRNDDSPIDFGNTRVRAEAVEGKQYRVILDDMQIGPFVNRGEAVIIVGWISSSLTDNHVTMAVPTAE